MKRQEISPKSVIGEFDRFLESKGLAFEAVIIGGAALEVMGVIDRATVDVDVLVPTIPEEIQKAAEDFRAVYFKRTGETLIEKWLNNGPSSLTRDLEPLWKARITPVYQGRALILHTLGRRDLIASKLFAFCDRDERDLGDLIRMLPTRAELLEILPWVTNRDANPDWPKHVKEKIGKLARRLGYEL